jgi:uncharacterized protein YciI
MIGRDRENSLESRLQVRDSHLARVRKLLADGRLVLAGPFPAIDVEEASAAGFSGSLIVAEFESLEDATSWFMDDPYVASGVFASYEVKPFMQVLP